MSGTDATSRFLFLPMPAHGHLNPTLPVAAELVARGHEVTYLLPGEFRDVVTATGAALVEYEGRAPERPRTAADGGTAFGRVLEQLMAIAEDVAVPLLDLHDRLRPDVVVGEAMSLWSGMLAAARPVTTVQLSTSYVMGPDSPMTQRMAAAMPGGRPPIDVVRLAAVGARYGARVEDPGAVLWGPAATTVVFMPAEFHPGHELLGSSVHFVGPPTGRQEALDGFDLAALDTTPGIYVSLGTVFNEQREFFHSCVEAFGGGDRPVVLNHGRRLTAADFPGVPDNVLLAPHVPQLRVLERSAAFVTHGGMGSTMEAVLRGVPMVVVPQMPEQAFTAERVAELGMGVRLDPGDATAETLAAAVGTVLADPSYREAVARMGAAARAAGGAPAAADVLESAARQSSTGARSSSHSR
jgi:MGT family glycosyltransferase